MLGFSVITVASMLIILYMVNSFDVFLETQPTFIWTEPLFLFTMLNLDPVYVNYVKIKSLKEKYKQINSK